MKNVEITKVQSSPLSRFVKQASSTEKKKVYKKVIMAATKKQNETIALANR
ncbi:hypothetical protein L0B53_03455 [Vibrio sp. SS-MA-C1-2]|uniref:hypothetical protein n=1 Tax=Vibrio sp. SS-MA-C1-2 TaxID=2908646 RepID=UPI001F1C5510|nr:hypothetical protein [Vibrio sp. SS-MA-C1-2]UJF17010.1 hypothetical protein L0B53_03455 [Vibrio sp. SS-MA-C1-2]